MTKLTTNLALPRRGKIFKSKQLFLFKMPSSGQLNGHEEREPISPAIPAEEDQSSTHKRGVTHETSGNPRPLGRGGGQIFVED